MSRKIRTLLKQNRVLEEKIFYEPRETDWREQLISTQELSDTLSCLSSRIIENQSDELCVLRMLNDIESIAGRPLPAYEKNALQVVEILFNYIRAQSSYAQQYYHILNSLQLAFTRLSLNDLSFLDNPKHVAVKFLERLLSLGYHFNDDAGNIAKFFIRAIELLVDRLANREQVTNQTFMMAQQKLEGYFVGFDEKVDSNIAIIMSKIEAESKKYEAERYTDQLIKSKTQGEEIPIFLLDFFEGQVKQILYDTIAKHGVQSKQTQQILADMDAVAWSITATYGDTTYNQRYEADVPPAMRRFYQKFEDAGGINEYVKEFFHELESIHADKLQGLRVNYDVMISADIFADEDFDSDDPDTWHEPPSKHYFNVESLRQDAWYDLTIEGKTILSRLLIINELSQELIFVNLSGELVLRIDFDHSEFLSKNLKPRQTEEQVAYHHATKALTRELNARLEILKDEYEKFLHKQTTDEEQQRQHEKASRRAVKQKIDEERRQQTLEREQAQQREKERLTEQQRMEELDAKQRFYVKGVYRKLKPGVVVAYRNEAGKWHEAVLSLISRTTQRHIFTDSGGRKLFEPDKEEVFELIKKESLKVVKEAPKSNDPLQSLVKDRRQKLSQL